MVNFQEMEPRLDCLGEANQAFKTVPTRIKCGDRPRGSCGYNALAASSTSSAWPSTRTLRQILATRPSAPTKTVVRIIPRNVLPYMDFLPQAPYASSILCCSSETKGTASRCLFRNASCAFTGSAETPSTAAPAAANASFSRVKSIASLVQPGVSARG